MRINDAKLHLELMLLERGIAPDFLDPWDTWRTFLAFLREPVACNQDSGSVQGRRGTGVDGRARFYLSLIRQLCDVENGRLVPIRHIVLEMAFDERSLDEAREWTVWTDDYETLADFIGAVRDRREFEWALNAPVVSSELFEAEC